MIQSPLSPASSSSSPLLASRRLRASATGSPPLPPPAARHYAPRFLPFALLFLIVYTSLCAVNQALLQAASEGHSHVPTMRTNTTRDWHEPDYALLNAAQPHAYGCNVSDTAPLIFLGVFSAVLGGRARRDLYRQTVMQEYPTEHMTVRFILAHPRVDQYPVLMRSYMRQQIERQLAAEIRQHGDIVVLDTIDNMDDGKTHAFLKYMASQYAENPGRPRFVVKADDDTIFAVPNLISAFRDLDCRDNVYWGTSAGADESLSFYMRGLAYGLSWPLVAWLGSVELPHAHESQFEDARTGQWLQYLDPVSDPVQRVDLGWSMGDWTQVNVTTETVSLHYLKTDRWFIEQHERIRSIWHTASRPYAAENGVPLADSIAHGAVEPGIRRTGVVRFCVEWNIVWACHMLGLEKPWYTKEYKALLGHELEDEVIAVAQEM